MRHLSGWRARIAPLQHPLLARKMSNIHISTVAIDAHWAIDLSGRGSARVRANAAKILCAECSSLKRGLSQVSERVFGRFVRLRACWKAREKLFFPLKESTLEPQCLSNTRCSKFEHFSRENPIFFSQSVLGGWPWLRSIDTGLLDLGATSIRLTRCPRVGVR